MRLKMRCSRRLDKGQGWSCKEEGLMFQERYHSQVNQTSVGTKGVLFLNTLLVAGEFAAQGDRIRLTLKFELYRRRTSKERMVRQSYI